MEVFLIVTNSLAAVGYCPLCREPCLAPAFLPDYADQKMPAVCRRHLPPAVLGSEIVKRSRYQLAAEVAYAQYVAKLLEARGGDHTAQTIYDGRVPGDTNWRKAHAARLRARKKAQKKHRKQRRTLTKILRDLGALCGLF